MTPRRLPIVLASLALLAVLVGVYGGAYLWRLHVRGIIPLDLRFVSPGPSGQPLPDTIYTTHVDLWLFSPAVRVHKWLQPSRWKSQP